MRTFRIILDEDGWTSFVDQDGGGRDIADTPLRSMARKAGRYLVKVRENPAKGFVKCVIRRYKLDSNWGYYFRVSACPRLCRKVGFDPSKQARKTLYVKAVVIK